MYLIFFHLSDYLHLVWVLLWLPAEYDAIILLLEPFLCILSDQFMLSAYFSFAPPPVRDVVPSSSKNNVEVHAVNPYAGVIFNPQIYMFLNTKSKAASVAKVAFCNSYSLTLRPRSRISSA